MTYDFDDVRVDTTERIVVRNGQELPVTPKVFAVLEVLIENAGHVVTKETLLDKVWPGLSVEEGSVARAVSTIRKLLGDTAEEPRYIQTLTGRGYRFLHAVETVTTSHAVPTDPLTAPDYAALGGSQSARLPPSNLRDPSRPLIGRENDLARVAGLLADPAARWITLTGLGGVGKTSLATRAAGSCTAFADSVYVVSLASISDSALVIAALARALGVEAHGTETTEDALVRTLRGARRPLLIVLDNFEHVAAAAPDVSRVLHEVDGIKVLATSRALLHLSAEIEFVVEPLDTASATSLFVARAALARPGFQPTASEQPDIVTLCERLAGLPLAIEVAAARIKLLPPKTLLSRLEGRLLTLTGARDLPDRHRTLKAAIDWSYSLLTADEQRLFRRLSVFPGGWTLESAEAIANAREDLGIDLLEGLGSLADKSMIARVPDATGAEPRFTMPELLREFALERLAAAGEAETCRRAHAAYCLVLAEEGGAAPDAASQNRWLEQCDADYFNIRAAVTYVIDSGAAEWALRLSAALSQFWLSRRTLSEADRLTRAAVNLPAAAEYPRHHARALLTLSFIVHALGNTDESMRFAEQSMATFTAAGDQRGAAAALNAIAVHHRDSERYAAAAAAFAAVIDRWREVRDLRAEAIAVSNLASVWLRAGRFGDARRHYAESRELFAAVGDRTGATWTLLHEGDAAKGQDDRDAARSLYSEARKSFQETFDEWGSSSAETSLGDLALDAGDVPTARTFYAGALTTIQRLGSPRAIARLLDAFARAAARSGQPDRALRLAGAAHALRQQFGAHLPAAERALLDRALRDARAGASAAAWQDGLSMPPERAAAYALSDAT